MSEPMKKTFDGTWTISMTFYWGWKWHYTDTASIWAVVLPCLRIYICAFDPVFFVISKAQEKKAGREG